MITSYKGRVASMKRDYNSREELACLEICKTFEQLTLLFYLSDVWWQKLALVMAVIKHSAECTQFFINLNIFLC